MLYYALSSLLIAVVGVTGIQLPRLTGHHPVGRVDLELIDYSRVDPFAPSPQPREFMVSVFYPTSETAVTSGSYVATPYFSSLKTVDAFSSYVGNSTELLKITTQSHYKAPMANSDFPVLIFSHGLGSSRVLHTAQLEALASHGWIIVAPDHPYDALITEFRNGNVVRMLPSVLDDFPSQMPTLVEVRVADVNYIASALKNSTILSKIPGLISSGGILRHSNRIGIFGHSLGGATAAQAVANFSTFPCGANFDGGIFGPVARMGLDKPFLQIEAQNHNQTSDTTFTDFWNYLRGFRREFMVNGTVHPSFMDIPVLRDLLGEAFPAQLRTQYGIIDGKRLLKIETALINAFFTFCLDGGYAYKLDYLAQGVFPDVFKV